MSDGSRVDVLRRANAGRLSTEQVVPAMNVDDEKWRDLNEKLAEDLPGAAGTEAKFDNVYLIDDFTASGTTFIRKSNDKWKVKLKKFNDLVVAARAALGEKFPLAENFSLHIHHSISIHQP